MSDPYPQDDFHPQDDSYSPDDSAAWVTPVESTIRAAGHYVRASQELRPRTLEAARQHCGDRRAEQKLGGFVLAVMLLLMLSSPAIQYVDVLRSQASAPTTREIQSRAIEYASDPGIGPNWGLTEAFTQVRRFQASRLGQSYRSVK